MKQTFENRRPLQLRGRVLHPASDCALMGILNVTPDSFSDGGSYADTESAVRRALEMEDQGADILDIGGESTRPGAREVSEREECARVLPVIEALRARTEIPISIDTRHASVARAAMDAGADIINDVSALLHDPGMAEVAARSAAPVVLMHMQGTPSTMQHAPVYDNVVEDVKIFFTERIAFCREAGIAQIVLDPGIGFGKTLEHNVTLLRELAAFAELGYPLLVGTSRKAFIGTLTGAAVDARLPGSIASNVMAYLNGAHILRVHDVQAIRAAIDVAAAIAHGEVPQHAG